ncbi:hypothetical protein EC844_11837 [Acinetobacter calcoaceticus]|uniref:BioF2-like acetyltransferase domain-containing protein n=1 Tax=Acinetobacter calcoaceticus TaxID=471 RepID=A0A4R1XMW3_ACICA|nr:hypothetical protein EC844_11837 [Acinetobacter calcoaceticus]
MQFNVKKYTATERYLWNNFIVQCKNYHFMFHRDFMEYHADRFHDFSLIITDGNQKTIALIPGNISEGVFYSHQGLTFGGFLIDKNIHAIDVMQIFTEVKKFLKINKINKIIYKPIPVIYHQYPAQEDLYALFRNDAQLHRRDISSSILIQDGYKYSRGKKSGINKAKKEGVVCREVDKPSLVWTLIREVLAEHHSTSPVHDEVEIDYLKEKFPNNIKTYAAFYNQNIVSACVTFETAEVVHTQYLASSKIGREIRALDMLIDHVICTCSDYAKVFDFGISNEHNGKYLNSGLIHQKESFGARAIVYDLYSMDIN